MKKLALMGLTSGFILVSQGAESKLLANENTDTYLAVASCGSCSHTNEPQPKQNSGSVEDETFTTHLTERAKVLYYSLDTEGKQLARQFGEKFEDKNEAVIEAAKKKLEKK